MQCREIRPKFGDEVLLENSHNSYYLPKGLEPGTKAKLVAQRFVFYQPCCDQQRQSGDEQELLYWVNLGLLTFTNHHPVGNVSSIKSAWTNDVYPNGFTNVVSVLSSQYMAPAVGTGALAVTNGTISIQDGNLSSALVRNLTLATNNVITITPTDNLVRLGLASKLGTFKGTFVNAENTNKVTAISGAILQQQMFGGGLFVGTNETVKVLLQGN